MAYLFRASSDDGATIAAVDVNFRGMFHQRWSWDEDTLGFAATSGGSTATGIDSHLMPWASSLVALAPREDNNVFTSPAALADIDQLRDYGVGSSLRGAWGYAGAEQRSAVDLAYLVIPRGSESQLEYAIDVATRDGNTPFSFRQGSFPAPPVLPPPAPPVFPSTPLPDPLPHGRHQIQCCRPYQVRCRNQFCRPCQIRRCFPFCPVRAVAASSARRR